MPESPTHNHVTANGVRLHYVRQGKGRPLVLVHGWPGFWYEWAVNIASLATRFDVIVPDMRGFGDSEKPDLDPVEGYAPRVMGEDLAGLVRALGLEQASFVAHDFGAVWVQAMALAQPDMVERLVLFNPPYPGIGGRYFEMPQVLEVWYQIFHQQPWAEDLVGSSRRATEVYLRHFLSHWASRPDVFSDDDLSRYVDAYSQPGAWRAAFNCYRAAWRTSGQGLADQTVQAPTLVLWGDRDPIFPLAWSDRLPEFFPNLTLKTVEGGGHFLMREAPERANQEISDFVAR
jgi:pimeloyl-ACP methyl ester carboxylesterase